MYKSIMQLTFYSYTKEKGKVMQKQKILEALLQQLQTIIHEDKKNIFYLLYYSLIEGVLLMVSPLASAFIINSVLAHAMISIYTLSIIVVTIFLLIAFLQVIKEYIIEKFEQKIFIKNSIKIAQLAVKTVPKKEDIDKYLNYFFDVISIQKVFPTVLLNGSSLVIKLIISMLLLLIFDLSFFLLGMFFIVFFIVIVLWLGKKAPMYAIERSNAKHEAIYYLQEIPYLQEDASTIFTKLDKLLKDFVYARKKMFGVIVKQLSLTFFLEGFVLSTFFIIGGYLVFEGIVPIGEFVAVEIIIISLVAALRDFMKQIDYMYDMIEGFYKIEKLKNALGEEPHV